MPHSSQFRLLPAQVSRVPTTSIHIGFLKKETRQPGFASGSNNPGRPIGSCRDWRLVAVGPLVCLGWHGHLHDPSLVQLCGREKVSQSEAGGHPKGREE